MSKPQVLVSFNAQWVAIAHTIFAYSAFFIALAIGCWLHYYKIIENEYYSYPQEWFPSVSATIGDRYPERSIFQILIALTAGPRFALLFLNYLRNYKVNSSLPIFGLISGIIRTFTCGGWVYITSTDDHDWHDILMISYIILTIPWDVSVIKLTHSKNSNLKLYRSYTSLAFFFTLIPLIYLFIQHKVNKVPGAYSYYAYCEWLLIILDIAFDSWTIIDFKDLKIDLLPDGENSLKIDFYKKISFNDQLNENAKDLKTITSLDKSISKFDENFKLVKSFDNGNKIFNFLQISIQIINSCIFWSNLTGFLAMIWYFPLWHMGISGYEASITAVLLPIILVISPIRNFFAKIPQVPRILGAVLGIGAYLVELPEYRLLTSSIGVAFSAIGLSNELWFVNNLSSNNNQDAKYLTQQISNYYSSLFSIGLLLSAILKFAFATNNPIWPIMHKENGGWNNLGIFIGILSGILTPNYKKIHQTIAESSSAISYPIKTSSANGKESMILASSAFGALIYLIHSLLTDSSTIITWVWDGYPIKGPLPVPHGALSLGIWSFGIYYGLSSPKKTLVSYKFYGVGVLGWILLYNFSGWIGYIGGLILSFYLFSITPVILNNTGKFNPGLSFTFGYLIYIIFVLAGVWTVAYAFVPGGPLLRERTDIVYSIPLFFIGLGVYNANSSTNNSSNKYDNAFKSITKKFQIILIFLTILSGTIAFLRFPFNDPTPFNSETKSFTAGIWTIHFGLDNDLWASENRMRDLMKDLEIDIMGILESDTQRIVMGNRDLTQKIAQDLGYYTDFGPGPNKHTWGCALFSKFPIINSTHHLLPSPVGELAPVIHATLDIYDEFVDVFVFHSGQEEDVEDRRLQTLYLQNIMGKNTQGRPAILLSYLVTEPHKGNYNVHVSEKSGMHDIDPTDDDRWCEYILFKKVKRIGYARVSRGTITDTEVQVGKFMLADHTKPEKGLYTNERVDESLVNPNLRFPEMFYGDGVRGHRYHVFDEPRYFI